MRKFRKFELVIYKTINQIPTIRKETEGSLQNMLIYENPPLMD